MWGSWVSWDSNWTDESESELFWCWCCGAIESLLPVSTGPTQWSLLLEGRQIENRSFVRRGVVGVTLLGKNKPEYVRRRPVYRSHLTLRTLQHRNIALHSPSSSAAMPAWFSSLTMKLGGTEQHGQQGRYLAHKQTSKEARSLSLWQLSGLNSL